MAVTAGEQPKRQCPDIRDATRRECAAQPIRLICLVDWGMEEGTRAEEPTAEQDTAGRERTEVSASAVS
ncbi:MAG: hypothetical protein K1W31_12435 [Lachnospiraceae bacterium]